jgi:putative oxidoreductase
MTTNIGIAERLTFGHPADAAEVAPVRVAPRPTVALVARILIAAIFLLSGLAKLGDPASTTQYMIKAGIPAAGTLVYVAAVVEILGALAVISGLLTRLTALLLVVYLVIVTITLHGFWNFHGQAQQLQLVNFMKNLAILGGLGMLVANGAGMYSIDARIRRPIEP